MDGKACPACQRQVFSNGGHQAGCRLDQSSGLRAEFPGFVTLSREIYYLRKAINK
jgi:hypothetical protein